jgi:hypothetical protein
MLNVSSSCDLTMSNLFSNSSHTLSEMFLLIISIAAVMLNFSASLSTVRHSANTCFFIQLHKKKLHGPLNTGAWICFHLLNHAKVLLYGRSHFRKLRSVEIEVGNMEICRHFEISENLTFRWYRFCVDMLCNFLVFYPRHYIIYGQPAVRQTEKLNEERLIFT